MDFREDSKGITLISLIVTIIILLILAGVSINLISGGNGILGKTQTAVDETEKQTATEKINFKITSKQIDSYAENGRMPTLKELAEFLNVDDEIQYVYKESKAEASLDWWGENDNYSSIFTKLEEYPYEFEIGSDLRLASINGVKIADSSSNSSITEEQISKIIDEKINSKFEELGEKYATKDDLNNYATKGSLASMTRTELWSGENETSMSTTGIDPDISITLPDISSYKYIEFQHDVYSKYHSGYQCEVTNLIAVDQIKYSSDTMFLGDASSILFQNRSMLAAGYFKNSTTFKLKYVVASDTDCIKFRLRKICGIK